MQLAVVVFHITLAVCVCVCLQDYPEIVKDPMDLSTVQEKLSFNQYSGPQDFCEDMALIFSNSFCYNSQDNKVSCDTVW